MADISHTRKVGRENEQMRCSVLYICCGRGLDKNSYYSKCKRHNDSSDDMSVCKYSSRLCRQTIDDLYIYRVIPEARVRRRHNTFSKSAHTVIVAPIFSCTLFFLGCRLWDDRPCQNTCFLHMWFGCARIHRDMSILLRDFYFRGVRLSHRSGGFGDGDCPRDDGGWRVRWAPTEYNLGEMV